MSVLSTCAFTLVALLVLFAFGADAKKPKWHELEGYTYEKFVADFNRVGRSASEHAERRALFNKEIAAVRTHNADTTKTWKNGVNDFSDWTESEKRSLRGYSGAVRQHARASGMTKPERMYLKDSRVAPRSVDWRKGTPQGPVLTAVKNQGMCGSCWAHSTAETLESSWAQATGQLFTLSQQQVSSCTSNPQSCGGTGGCGGGIYELGIDSVVAAGGIVEEWSYPYTSYFGKDSACSYWKNLTKAKFTGYTQVEHNDQGAALHALAYLGPLAMSADASHWSPYESGIFNGCSYAKNISMDHAIQLVGYGEDSLGSYWIVRNSWSPSWGEDGYIKLNRAPFGHAESCGWNVNPQQGMGCKGQTAPTWACGECGVLVDLIAANADYNPYN